MEIRLSFDRDDKVYSAGDIITCSLHFSVAQEVKCRSISMRFLGIGNTDFKMYNTAKKIFSCKRIITSHSFTGYEEYFRHYKYFLGSKGALETVIEPGDYVYTESYELPPNIPQDFVDDYGSVQYSVRVKVENNWTTDLCIVELIKLRPIFNLLREPDRFAPVEVQKITLFNSLLHPRAHPIEIAAILTSGVYEFGDNIHVNVIVHNQSFSTIKYFLISLEECITFRGTLNTYANYFIASSKQSNNKDDPNHHEIKEEISSNRVIWSETCNEQVTKKSLRNFFTVVPIEKDASVVLLPSSKIMSSEHFIRIKGFLKNQDGPELIVKFKIATNTSEI